MRKGLEVFILEIYQRASIHCETNVRELISTTQKIQQMRTATENFNIIDGNGSEEDFVIVKVKRRKKKSVKEFI